MAFRDYLRREVAEDFADGLLTRRDALRRLVALGLATPAAAALLAACGRDEGTSGPPGSAAAPTGPVSPGSSMGTSGMPGTASIIRLPGPAGDLTASFAAAPEPKGGVLIVHENRGLTQHFKDLPTRFAADGYTALCVDLLSRSGGTDKVGDQATGLLGQAPPEQLVADLRAGLDELGRRAPGEKLGAVGFCFGGGMVWTLLDAGEARLVAASPFYGPCPADPDFRGAKAAVLAVYGQLDQRVNATRESCVAALAAAGLPHETKEYAGADHAFYNDTGARYHAEAARQAHDDLIAWFDRYLTA
jgi:carboxymethylenebutenolidase